jgi:hypothetical protein
LNCNDVERDSVHIYTYITGERENKEKRRRRRRKKKVGFIFLLESMQKQANEACCKQEKKIELMQM